MLAIVVALFLVQAAPELPAPKKITLTLGNSTLKAAADRLAKDGGYAIRIGDCDPKTKVSVKVDKVSFVQALDALCRSAGVSFKWDGNSIELLNEPLATPTAAGVAQVGPFWIRSWVGSWGDHDAALLFHSDWEPSAAVPWFMIKAETLLDPAGEAIVLASHSRWGFYAGQQTHYQKVMSVTGKDRGEEWKLDFFPLPPASKVKSVSGTLTVVSPAVKRQTVRFENPIDRARKTVDGFPLSLSHTYDDKKKIWRSRVDVELESIPKEKRLPLFGLFASQRIRFVGKGGASIPNLSLGGGGAGGSESNPLRDIHINGYCKVADATPLAAVEVDFFSEATLKDYPFEIKDIPVTAPKK